MHGIIALSPWGYPGIVWSILRSEHAYRSSYHVHCLFDIRSPRSGVHVFDWILLTILVNPLFMLCFLPVDRHAIRMIQRSG